MIKKVSIGLILLALVVGGGFYGWHTQVAPGPDQAFGAATGPDLPSPYFSFGGVRRWAGRTENLTQASTTVCAIQSPNATSTLVSAAIRFNTASSTAFIVDIAKDTTAFATTTKIGTTYGIVGGTQATIVASTSGSTIDGGAGLFAPNNYLVVKIAGVVAAGAGTAPVGACQATWEAI